MHEFGCCYHGDFRDSNLTKPLNITHEEVSWTTDTAGTTIHAAVNQWVAAATCGVAEVVGGVDGFLLVGRVVEVIVAAEWTWTASPLRRNNDVILAAGYAIIDMSAVDDRHGFTYHSLSSSMLWVTLMCLFILRCALEPPSLPLPP